MFLPSEILMILGPICGFFANLVCQIFLSKRFGRGLVFSIFGGFIIGALVTAFFLGIALYVQPVAALDGLALSASVFFIYGAAGFLLFAIINLGETSLRVRIMELLLEHPQGLTRREILDRYDDRHLLEVRLQRMVDNGQVTFEAGKFHTRASVLLLASRGIFFLKWLLYGSGRSGSHPGSLITALLLVFVLSVAVSYFRHASITCVDVTNGIARGRCLMRAAQDQYPDGGEAAAQLLRQAVDADPSNPDLPGNLGLVLAKLGNFEEALASFDRAIEVASQDITQRYLWSVQRAAMHRRIGALPALQEDCEEMLLLLPQAAAAEPTCSAIAKVQAGISVTSATYGGNCRARSGNATVAVAQSCNGKASCEYVVDVGQLSDPAPGCSKNFQVQYSCAPDTAVTRKELPGEAGLGSRIQLDCTSGGAGDAPVVASGLNIHSATYGGNCGAASGNATRDLVNSCSGRVDCEYIVDVERLRDPAPGCGKDFVVQYSCAPDSSLIRKELSAEAGLGSQLQLSCATAPKAEPVKSGLDIRTATYGGNCGAPSGNATRDLVNSCSGRVDCEYIVDVERLRDPAPGCGKDFVVEYHCAPNGNSRRADLPAEAGLKTALLLSCVSHSDTLEGASGEVTPLPEGQDDAR
jgi:tetratricopeptide (TPR) repeat protein